MNRRTFLALISGSSFTSLPLSRFGASASEITQQARIIKSVPSSEEHIPVIGMGTWITFNVGDSQRLRDKRTEVLKRFFELGGAMIDSSPMYGSAQSVVGEGLRKLNYPDGVFSADKIWTGSAAEGKTQFNEMRELWGLDKLDLVQVHNLVHWQAHLETLRELREQGLIKYIGITTSHGLRHEECVEILQSQPLDFIQLSYNITHREAEQRLLPLAAEKGVAVIANRPLDGGNLFKHVQGQAVPVWAADYDCHNWAQFFLKFVVSHPAVTCAIPATSQVEHMEENMGACYGVLPDAEGRRRMSEHIASI